VKASSGKAFWRFIDELRWNAILLQGDETSLSKFSGEGKSSKAFWRFIDEVRWNAIFHYLEEDIRAFDIVGSSKSFLQFSNLVKLSSHSTVETSE
jgi:hypothetical protein